jgi:hypothetical protein
VPDRYEELNLQEIDGRSRTGSGIARMTNADSQPSRRFPMFHLKICRTFTLFTNYDTKGTPQGTSKVRQVATLNETGNAYSGSGNFDVYDVHGKVLVSGTFTIQATRIRIEAP